MRRFALLGVLVLTACASATPHVDRVAPDLAALRQQVVDTETAFAKTMADRDFAAFQSFLAEDTLWFGGKGPLRGKAAVVESWKRFYDGPKAPFSWKPARVEVQDSGELALSSGPVFDPDGKPVGEFNSVWRREPSGAWRIIFDKGCDCPCGK